MKIGDKYIYFSYYLRNNSQNNQMKFFELGKIQKIEGNSITTVWDNSSSSIYSAKDFSMISDRIKKVN